MLPKLARNAHHLRKTKYLVPNSITALNMFFGFIAISYALEGLFSTAAWVIFLATLLDILDGRLARTLNASSKFGVEMDSFSDLVSFGVAPAVLIYQAFFTQAGYPGLVVAFLPALFAAFRLARFNVEWGRVEKTSIKGVPTPVCAWTLAGFVVFADVVWGQQASPTAAGAVCISIAFLMVSSIKFEGNAIANPRDWQESWKLIPFGLSLLTVALYGPPVLFLWACLYIGVGLTRWAMQHRPRRRSAFI
jgi:CDP-diacylglycerol--serine O-phosphatidyltransferase